MFLVPTTYSRFDLNIIPKNPILKYYKHQQYYKHFNFPLPDLHY